MRARAPEVGPLAHLGAVLAWVPLGLTLALAAGTLVLGVRGGHWDDALVLIPAVAFAAVGSIVVRKRPGNPIGWLFCVVGVILAAAVFATAYGYYAIVVEPGSLPGVAYAAFVGANIWAIAFFAGVLIMLLFPTGTPLSRRWRPLVWLQAVAVLALCVGVLGPEQLTEPFAQVENPLHIEGADVLEGVAIGAWFILVLSFVLAAIALVVRFRRSGSTERQQLKWMASAGVFFVAAFQVESFAQDTGWSGIVQETASTLATAALTSIPIAAGLAIFKYRLYELDVIIRRTLVYGVVTAGLAGLYFAIVLLLQQIFSSFAGGSDLAIAGSTLAVAALFRPVRARIQAFVDRRFFRRKYDAGRTLETFSARLREEIDLSTLRRELLGVVDETMRPANLSLWLREPGARR